MNSFWESADKAYTDDFTFQGEDLRYNRIQFNHKTERAVEVPLGFKFLFDHSTDSLMEVGNTLAHYENELSTKVGIWDRTIIDKFEESDRVWNKDLLRIDENEYDAVLSVSTLEHVGQGEEPGGTYGEDEFEKRDREKPLKAIRKIYEILSPEGNALITVPFGTLTDGEWYIQFSSEYLDLLFEKYHLPRGDVQCSFLRREAMEITGANPKQSWREVEDRSELDNVEYNHPYPCANAVAVIELEKNNQDLPPVEMMEVGLSYRNPYIVGSVFHNGFVLNAEVSDNGILSVDADEFFFYGPFADVDAGVYQFEYEFEIEEGGTPQLEVVTDGGRRTFFRETLRGEASRVEKLEIPDTESLEIRLMNDSSRRLSLIPNKLTFRQLD